MKTRLLLSTFLYLLATFVCPSQTSPFSITTQPASQTAILYQQAVFVVVARASGPLRYQWRKDGFPISGATNAQLVLNQVAFQDAGQYSVLVSMAQHTLASQSANLTVRLPKAGDLDGSLPYQGFLRQVTRLALQPDGKVLVAGDFSLIRGATQSGLGRLNTDCSYDYTFMSGLSGPNSFTSAILVLSNRDIIIAGNFSLVHGTPRGGIARLHPDGTLDAEFQGTLSGIKGGVSTIAEYADGKIIVAGSFTNINGVNRSGIARLNRDGTLDASFQDGFLASDGYIDLVAVQPDGKVVVGGKFDKINGVLAYSLTRMHADGTRDDPFTNGPSTFYRDVQCLALQNDGKILVGVDFVPAFNGVYPSGIVRLNSDGSVDPGWHIHSNQTSVAAISIQADGKILLGGRYIEVDGNYRGTFARLNSDGTLDPSFAGEGPSHHDPVYQMCLQPDGKVLLGGDRIFGNDVRRNGIARLNSDGTLDSSFNMQARGLNELVFCSAAQPDGKLLIGGGFFLHDDNVRGGIIRLHRDGSLDNGFYKHSPLLYNVLSIALQPDGKILVGGEFTEVDGATRRRVARLHSDGTLDRSFMEGMSGVSGGVEALGVQSDGKVILGGYFDRVNGVTQRAIARLNPDGSLDTQFRATNFVAAPAAISAILVEPDDSILVGGAFTMFVSNKFVGRLLRLNADGTVDTNFFKGASGPSDAVAALAKQNDGRLLVGGRFTNFNGVPCSGLVRLHSDGTLDTTFQSNFETAQAGVEVIRILKDGRILVGGSMKAPADPLSYHIARLRPDGNVDTNFIVTADQRTSTIQESDNRILIGGRFTRVNGMAAAYLARVWPDAPSYVEKAIPLDDGSSTLTLRLPAGTTNRVQYKNSLKAANWTDLPGDIVTESEVSTNIVDTTAGTTQERFYRVKQVP